MWYDSEKWDRNVMVFNSDTSNLKIDLTYSVEFSWDGAWLIQCSYIHVCEMLTFFGFYDY